MKRALTIISLAAGMAAATAVPAKAGCSNKADIYLVRQDGSRQYLSGPGSSYPGVGEPTFPFWKEVTDSGVPSLVPYKGAGYDTDWCLP